MLIVVIMFVYIDSITIVVCHKSSIPQAVSLENNFVFVIKKNIWGQKLNKTC